MAHSVSHKLYVNQIRLIYLFEILALLFRSLFFNLEKQIVSPLLWRKTFVLLFTEA